MAKRKRDQVARTRKAIIGAFVALVILVVGYGLLYSTGVTDSGTISAGTHYRVVEGAPETLTPPIEIVEYFSYGCIHCRNFDPIIEEWKDTLPEGAVFKRVHAAYAPGVTLLAKAHITLNRHGALEQNHTRLFRAIHDRNNPFDSPAEIADFVDGFGISRDEFLTTFDSPRVQRAAQGNDQRFRALRLTGVPALVVGDKYVINMEIGRAQSLEAARRLVEDALAGSAATET